MATVTRQQLFQTALKFVQKGQYDKALDTLKPVMKAVSKDPDMLRRVAEWQFRINRHREALENLRTTAALYRTQGFLPKAAAILAQLLTLEPNAIDTLEQVADVAQQMGRTKEAIGTLEKLLGLHTARRDHPKRIETVRMLSELEPHNLVHRVRLADIYAEHGMVDEAVRELTDVLRQLKQENRVEEYIQAAERILHLKPDRQDLLVEVAEIRLAKGDRAGALERLHAAYAAGATHIPTLSALIEYYTERTEPEAVQNVARYTRELARVHEAEGDARAAQALWRKVAELAPDDDEAKAKMTAEPSSLARPESRVLSSLSAEAASRAAESSRSDAQNQQVERIRAEVAVYTRYGLLTEALRHLDTGVMVAPHAVEIHAQRVEVAEKIGNPAGVVTALLGLCQALVRNDRSDEVAPHLLTLQALAPHDPRVDRVVIGDVAFMLPACSDAIESSAQIHPSDTRSTGGAGDAGATDDDDESVDVDMDMDIDLDLDEGESDADGDGGPSDADAAGTPASDPDSDAFDLMSLAAAAADSLAASLQTPVTEDAAGAGGGGAVPPNAGSGAGPAVVDVAEDLETAGFFLQQGLVDDAIELYRTVLARDPNNSEARDHLVELGALAS